MGNVHLGTRVRCHQQSRAVFPPHRNSVQGLLRACTTFLGNLFCVIGFLPCYLGSWERHVAPVQLAHLSACPVLREDQQLFPHFVQVRTYGQLQVDGQSSMAEHRVA